MDSLSNTKWAQHRKSVELWKVRNRSYYLAQKRRLAARPAYLAHRRVQYRLRQLARSDSQEVSLSAIQIDNDIETTDETGPG